MKAHLTITLHDAATLLDAVQLGHLTTLIVDVFGMAPELRDDDMVIHAFTLDHIRAHQAIEQFTVELHYRFSPQIWVSTASEEIP